MSSSVVAAKRRRVASAPVIATHLWTNILGFNGPSTWMIAAKVNKQIKAASDSDVLWAELFEVLWWGENAPRPQRSIAVEKHLMSGCVFEYAKLPPKQALANVLAGFCPGCDTEISKRCLVPYGDVCDTMAHEESSGYAGEYTRSFTKFEQDQCNFFSEKYNMWGHKPAPENRYSTLRGVWGGPVCHKCAHKPEAQVMSKTAVAKHCKVSAARVVKSDLPRFSVGRSVYFAVTHHDHWAD